MNLSIKAEAAGQEDEEGTTLGEKRSGSQYGAALYQSGGCCSPAGRSSSSLSVTMLKGTEKTIWIGALSGRPCGAGRIFLVSSSYFFPALPLPRPPQLTKQPVKQFKRDQRQQQKLR